MSQGAGIRGWDSPPVGAAVATTIVPPLNLSGDALTTSTLTVESSQGVTQAAPMVLFDVNNAAFDEPALKITNVGVGAALRLEGNGTLSSNTRNVLEVVSVEAWDATTLGVSGFQDDLGTFKLTHKKPALADGNSAALSILLDNPQTSGSSAAQGIFLDTSNTGVGSSAHTQTAKLLNLRSGTTEKFVLRASGETVITRTDSGDALVVNNTSANATRVAANSAANQQALFEARDNGTTKWQIGKQNTPHDFMIFNNNASEFLMTGAIGGGRLNLVPNVGDVMIGSAAAPSATLTLDAGSQTARVLDDIEDGDNWTYSTNDEGTRWRIRQGTGASPNSQVGVMVKMTRIQDVATDATNTGTDPSLWATLGVIHTGRAGTNAQSTAIFAYANTEATVAESFPIDNPDATAIIGIGNVHTNGTGNALGGYFEAAMNSTSTPSGKGQGQAGEFQVRNNAADVTYSATNLALAKGVFITTSGTFKVNAALAIGNSGGADFLTGILIATGSQGDAVQDASFRDEGNAARSIHIKNTHSSGAIVIESTTGGFIEMFEQGAAPSAPAANGMRMYLVDNGGKTELRALFNTGASQLIAAQP